VKITCVDEQVGATLQRGYYEIPRFQRPFAWDPENIDDFLEDVIERGGDDYFIGSMVVYDAGNSTYAVVDGQQRLTTITLLLCALRDSFDELEDADSAAGLQGLVERRDLKARERYVLQTPSGYPYFQDVIQRHGEPDGDHEIGPDEKRLADAFSRVRRYIRGSVNAIQGDKTKNPKARRAGALERLEEMRDRVLALKLILIEVDKPDDAYFIFETLNTRGKDLGVSDLVRNLLMSHLTQDNADVDLARDAFEGILVLFRSSRADINVNKFLLHQWLSQHSYVSEAKLFRAIRSEIKNKQQAKGYLSTLKADARLYLTISEPTAPLRAWKKEEAAVRESLEALAMFGVTQPLPMLLSLMRAYERKEIKLAALKQAVQAIEDFHFAFTAVASQPSSGGISSMYALHARQLAAAENPNVRSREIKALIEKLREKRPSRELFVAGFQDLRASELFSQQRRLVTYILRRFHSERVGPPPSPDVMTIEHIANQSKAKDPGLVAMVGNLLYVDLDLNEKLGSKGFAAKRGILRGASGIWVDDFILGGDDWGTSEIEERTIEIAEQAYDDLWSF
jgi:hypothetical protein